MVSGSLAWGNLSCGNGPSANNETCSNGNTAMIYCYLGCGATVNCASGGDVMGLCMAMQCCNGGVPIPKLDSCITGGTARWDCRSGSIYDQPCCCTNTCINTINCTNGS
jgi:hypothetical protein